MHRFSGQGSCHLKPPAWWFHTRPPVGPVVRLLAVGDIGLSGRVSTKVKPEDTLMIADGIVGFLQSSPLVLGNLETPLIDEFTGKAHFAAPSYGAAVLARAGFTHLHLANNHIRDFGIRGFQSTLEAFAMAGLTPLGVGKTPAQARKLLRTDRGGLRIGWLACGRTLHSQGEEEPFYWEFDEDELLQEVRQARPGVDVLIVSIHIGLMYLDYPHPDHKAFAERLSGAGVDLVLMHHAHVLQGIQVLGDRHVICYNLGNFLFDWQEGNVRPEVAVQEQQEGAVFCFELDREGVCAGSVLPTLITEDCRVQWALGERGDQILQRLQRISRDLEGDYTKAFLAQRADRNAGLTVKVFWFHLKRGNWPLVLDYVQRLKLSHLRMTIQWLLQGTLRWFRGIRS